jgi:hypothetical protein
VPIARREPAVLNRVSRVARGRVMRQRATKEPRLLIGDFGGWGWGWGGVGGGGWWGGGGVKGLHEAFFGQNLPNTSLISKAKF